MTLELKSLRTGRRPIQLGGRGEDAKWWKIVLDEILSVTVL